jgi:hypothetical protein
MLYIQTAYILCNRHYLCIFTFLFLFNFWIRITFGVCLKIILQQDISIIILRCLSVNISQICCFRTLL